MRFREIVRFEFDYQARHVRTWLYFAVLLVIAFLQTRSNTWDDAQYGGVYVNSPYSVAASTGLANILWLLLAPVVAGGAAARDIQIGMHALVYTTPLTKAVYLGGRAVAAFALNALILLAVPAGMVLAVVTPGIEAELVGPFRPAAYLSAYAILALPTALAGTALQFAMALGRRAITSYIGSVLLIVIAIAGGIVTEVLRMPTLGQLLEPIGYFTVIGTAATAWTPLEKNTILIALRSPILANRAVWFGIALGVFAFTLYRFRFAHPITATWRRRRHPPLEPGSVPSGSGAVPMVTSTFGSRMQTRQVVAITRASFAAIASSRVGLVFLVLVPMLAAGGLLASMNFSGVPLLPRTERSIRLLTSPLTAASLPWALVPLLIVFWAGELVWRDRDARLSDITDSLPVPEWVLLVGKFLGLALILVVWEALLALTGIIVQLARGQQDFEIGLYLRALLGLQLADYLLFAALALAVHVIVSDRYLGYLAALMAYAAIAFAPRIGIEHNLLIYGSDPGWSYSDMRGFGPALAAWAWFKLYWTAWAFLLAVTARVLWVRGRERRVRLRLRLARERLVGLTAGAVAAAVALIAAVGGFVFYNTNILNAYDTAAERTTRGAAYERQYRRYSGIPQPRVAATTLHLEIYPERRQAEARGTYRLVNDSGVAIAAIHIVTSEQVETRTVSIGRPVARVREDDHLDYRIYELEQPLQPGEALTLTFELRYQPRGFRHRGVDAAVVANGTSFTSLDWLPAIGYQQAREIRDAGARKQHGLGPRSMLASLDDPETQVGRVGGDRIAFDAIVGTGADQIAIAPGTLRRTWTEAGRRYFHYSTDAAINNRYAFFSANYELHRTEWSPSAGSEQTVAIEIYHHPEHAEVVPRIVASARASLEQFTRQFGPYPHTYLRFVENPVRNMGAHAEAATIDYGDDFSLLHPGNGQQDFDLVFAVIAHEVAHQWWGMQLAVPFVAGAGLLIESVATFSAMQLVEETLAARQLRRYRLFMQEEYREPRTRAAPPLLRSTDSFSYYRKGPSALYALREYIGKERVDEALRRVFEKHRAGTPPLPTTVDLYRELQAVTPESFQYLLHDLFEANTFWDLETKRATAQQINGGWRVTLDVHARKVVVDEVGTETELPMDELIPIGLFAAPVDGRASGAPLYLQLQRVRSGAQTITVTIPGGSPPIEAGIDPSYLLHHSDGEVPNNVVQITVLGTRRQGSTSSAIRAPGS